MPITPVPSGGAPQYVTVTVPPGPTLDGEAMTLFPAIAVASMLLLVASLVKLSFSKSLKL